MLDTQTISDRTAAYSLAVILKFETITKKELASVLGNVNAADRVIALCTELGALEPGDEDNTYVIPFKSFDDIPDKLKDIMSSNGVDLDDVKAYMGNADKTISSNIVATHDENWISVEDKLPDKDVPVVAHIINRNIVDYETRCEVYYIEDAKIASWDGNKWVIMGPHPLFDYSPCTSKFDLNEGCEVVHWTPATEQAVEEWRHRLDPSHIYESFEMSFDNKYKSDMYKALLMGATCIKHEMDSTDDEKVKHTLAQAYGYIMDIRCVMDRGGVM